MAAINFGQLLSDNGFHYRVVEGIHLISKQVINEAAVRRIIEAHQRINREFERLVNEVPIEEKEFLTPQGVIYQFRPANPRDNAKFNAVQGPAATYAALKRQYQIVDIASDETIENVCRRLIRPRPN